MVSPNKLTLQRLKNLQERTIGELLIDVAENIYQHLCYTLELPYRDNKEGISRILPGTYRVTKFDSPTKGHVFLLHDVPGHTMIEMHIGNTEKDVRGCIAVGTYKSDAGIGASAVALALMMQTLPDEFMLEVKDA